MNRTCCARHIRELPPYVTTFISVGFVLLTSADSNVIQVAKTFEGLRRSFWRQRNDELQTPLDPVLESCPGVVASRANVNEANHRPTCKVHRTRVRLRKRFLMPFCAHPDDNIFAYNAAAHVAINHERKPSEHSLLLDQAFCRQDFADSVGYAFIDGHLLLAGVGPTRAIIAGFRHYDIQANGFSSALRP
jgi:hypothetical protein